jgi:hypothetical protein
MPEIKQEDDFVKIIPKVVRQVKEYQRWENAHGASGKTTIKIYLVPTNRFKPLSGISFDPYLIIKSRGRIYVAEKNRNWENFH